MTYVESFNAASSACRDGYNTNAGDTEQIEGCWADDSGPRSPARNPLPTISITESRISGALEPRAISVRFATVSFHICQHQKHKQNPLRYKYKCSNFRSRVDPETRKLYFISIRQVSLTIDFWYFATY